MVMDVRSLTSFSFLLLLLGRSTIVVGNGVVSLRIFTSTKCLVKGGVNFGGSLLVGFNLILSKFEFS